MQVVSQVSLDCPQEKASPLSELSHGSENLGNRIGDSSLLSSSEEHVCLQMPVKKQTRRWAAWTRQEEESFFSALRQVGKNFDKITCRVQSKNKDQVRHYYYRLVRRMNKLLDPDLCLDAKNSKDTNSAMLRWWSLLEKYSCKASKLHLKPRRFKIFVETLENQLLRDRKKSIKRRVSTGESSSSFHNISSSDQSKASGHDNRAIKIVLESQNVNNKVGNGKGALSRCPTSIGTRRLNYKSDPADVKTSNQRWKRAAAYKKWEKAAIAGVSLVADAAEHLERVDTDKEIGTCRETSALDGSRLGLEVAPQSLPSPPHNMFKENGVHNPAKLKLQLFPVDEGTRRILEMENHNPHLELTLSTRKKISSVLEHLNRKWRNTSFPSRDLVLFPFWVQGEKLLGYQKWTKDSSLCAADVYCSIGSPPIFRLRYGWFSRDEIESAPAQSMPSMELNDENGNQRSSSCDNHRVSSEPSSNLAPQSSSRPCASFHCNLPIAELNSLVHNDETGVALADVKDISDISVKEQAENMKQIELSAGEWADSLTDDITLGDLLSGSMHNMDIECPDYPAPLTSNSVQQMPFCCDSFDAAIAAHIYKHRNHTRLPENAPLAPSIWEAEDTCDAFSFQKSAPRVNDKEKTAETSYNIGTSKLTSPVNSPASYKEFEELPEVDGNLTDNDHIFGDPVDDSSPDHNLAESSKDFGGLTDIYWPDSLGPLNLDVPPSCRYSTDLILSDSLSGLNRLVANSLDAFQNCSFFGIEKKETASTAETE